MLNLPGTEAYNPSLPWVMQRRADNSMASVLTCFVNDQRVTGDGGTRVVEAGHALSTRESYLGLQDAPRKLRHPEGSKHPGAWAGVNVVIKEDGSVAVTVTQEKWDRLKAICRHWLAESEAGHIELDFKKLRSDRGFLVYVTQAYPGMKPYLKGFHLSLESWREGRDAEGWKLISGGVFADFDDEYEMDAEKLEIMTRSGSPDEAGNRNLGPLSGLTKAVPRFKDDLKALLNLSEGLEGKDWMTCMWHAYNEQIWTRQGGWLSLQLWGKPRRGNRHHEVYRRARLLPWGRRGLRSRRVQRNIGGLVFSSGERRCGWDTQHSGISRLGPE